MRNKFIIIFLVYRFRSRGREATSVIFPAHKKAYLKWAVVDRTCYFDNALSHKPNSDEMHCLINNADPHHRYLSFPSSSLYVPLMCFVTPQPSEIGTSNLCFFFQTHLSTWAISAYWHSELLTWHKFGATCVLVKHGLSWRWLSFTAQDLSPDRRWWEIMVRRCSPHPTVLTILVSTPCPLSFCSCALANIPHQFLMHCHMVVLFFLRCCGK